MPGSPNHVDAEIIDLTHDGQGVADLDGHRVFVSGALPGELVRLAPRRRRRRFQEADLVRVLRSAEARVDPPCPYFGRCGGCAVQHLAYAKQVEFKETVVREALARLAGLEPAEWLAPIIGPEWYYRRRARLGVRFVAGKGRVLVGFKERATRLITDMSSCRVLVQPLDALPGQLATLIDQTTLKQRLPQAEIAAGESARALVLRVLDAPTDEDLRLLTEFGQQQDIDVYLQRGGPGTVEALDPATTRPLAYGLPEFGLTLEFAPTDFVQVNARVNEAIVGWTVEQLGVESSDRVLDLYCGLGNFSLPLASRAAMVVGVEGEGGLVARAAHNARRNGLENVRFVTADLSEPGWSFMRESWDLVVLDPPRSGAHVAVTQMARMGPRKIAYLSCHPATLARDAKELIDSQGYRLRAVGIADMFPHTHHVETLALFERR
ncbi:MAG: 23S rRNA (uracil(1939)-C(5))-methyltransferase RlmD [Gammaproteobacteria bacterium]